MTLAQFIVKRRVFFGFVFAAAFMALAQPSILSLLVGFPLGLPGLAIRSWSSGLIRKNKALAQDGPYAMARNPLYLGSFVAGLGVSIMGGVWYLALIFVVAYLVTYRRIILNEEVVLLRLFPEELPGYMQKVPRFFPNVTKFAGWGSYDVAQFRKHKEWQAWLGYLAIAGVLTAKLFLLPLAG